MIKLTQKETELKIDGRMFGQSPAYERLRRVIQEKHVSKAFKYNTHQSLTMSELDRISKLYEFSHAFKLYKDYIPFQISLDVEGWNDKFQSNLVNPCAESLYGRWFGQTGLWSHTMDLYENAYFIQ